MAKTGDVAGGVKDVGTGRLSWPNVITRSFFVRERQESQCGENQDIVKDVGSF